MNKFLSRLLKPTGLTAKLLLLGFVTVFLAFGVLDYFDPIKSFLDADKLTFQMGEARISPYLVIKAVISVVFLLWLAGMISGYAERKIKSFRRINSSNKALIIKFFQIFIYFVALLGTLDLLGIDLTALTVIGGAVGIGVGFGLQKIASNFISGLILLSEKSIEVDDLVEIDAGTMGFVRHTGARYTLIETFEGREVMVPNEDFITNRVTNWTFSNTKGRIDAVIGVSYGSDLALVKQLLLEAANEHERCSVDPAAECFLTDFGDSSVNFLLVFWVDDITAGRKATKSEVLFSIWNKFHEHNIEIPFPQRDLHIKTPGLLK